MSENERYDDFGAKSVVRVPGEGRVISLGDAGVVTLKADRGETGGNISAYEFAMPAKTAGPPLHLHRGWDEVFYVLAGDVTFLINGERSTAPVGTFVFVPRGVLHTFWNEGNVTARQLTVFTPAGIEEYFDDLTKLLAAVDDSARDAAAALMERHDMVVPLDTRPAYEPLGSTEPTHGSIP